MPAMLPETVSEHVASTTQDGVPHNSDAIMSAMASQITGVPIVYSTVCSGRDQRNNKAPCHWPL